MISDHDRFTCDGRFPGLQIVRLMRRAIATARLDLGGLNVLTEASVGYARITATLAALAGADVVYAVGRDTRAASRHQAEEQTRFLAELAHVDGCVRLLATRLHTPLTEIDVVTDLPGVRPLDEAIVRNLAPTAAVSTMRAAASCRTDEVDIATCRRHGIAVAALDEEAVGLHRYPPLGVLAALFDLGVEVDGCTIAVAGDGPTGPYLVRTLDRQGARVLAATPEPAGRVALYGGEKIGDGLTDEAVADRLAEADALVLCPADGATGEPALQPGAARLAAAAPHLAVVGLDAPRDLRVLAAAGLRCRPAGGAGGVFDLLPQALVAQHAAGLKVAEVMTRARRRGSSPLAAEQLAAAEAHAELLPQDLSSLRR